MSRGHLFEDILEKYTMNQVQAFVRAAEMDLEDEYFKLASASRAAQVSDKDWKKFVRAHQQKIQEGKPQQVMSRESLAQLRSLFKGKPNG